MELFGYEFLDFRVVVVAPLCRGNFVTILNATSQGAVLGGKGSGSQNLREPKAPCWAEKVPPLKTYGSPFLFYLTVVSVV